MGKNQSTFTAKLRIRAIIDEAQKELNTFGASLQKAWAGGEPPKSMNKAFEQMRVRLESIREISKKGVVNTSDLQRAEQDYQSFSKDIHNLSVEFKLMSTEQKRAMLSKEEQDNIRARAAAIKEYTAAMEKNNKVASQIESLEKEKEDIKAGQVGRRQAESTIKDVEPRLSRLKNAGGPLILSKEAQEYKNTLKEQEELLAKVEQAQARVNSLSKKGLKEGGNNQLTEARKQLDELQEQQKKFNDLAGKSEYEEALSKYNQEIASLENTLSSANEDLAKMDAEFAEIDEQLKKLSVKDMTSEFDALKKRLQGLGVEGIDSAKDITELRKAVQDLDDKAIAGVDEEIKKMISELKKMGSTALQAKQGIDQATDSIEQQKDALREQEAFENKIKQFLGLSGAAQVLRSAFRDAMSTIKELDATMTEMAVVTDLTVGDYWDQLPEYSKRASELGVSINSAYKAATLYYQQGLKTNEVVALSTETMKMARIAGIDTALATDRMTAALRGFNMELDETNAKKIADVYSELAAITAADVKEISAAMTKTASIASSAGMEFETTAAFLSQIIETTRESAETAGTALKTVIARFQELKKDPAEIGEVDGEIVDANKIETALRSVGVALRDSEGQFRKLDDVFLELSGKWNTLDTNTQRYIATIAAGSRQQSRFIAMMQDYGRTQELVSAANNSAGASNRQFEKTMESLDAKMEKLKNAWHEFTMGITDSKFIKTGIDILTKFLEILNKMTDGFGEKGVFGGVMKLMTVFGVFKLGMTIFKKFEGHLASFFGKVVEMAGVAGHDSGKKFTEEAKRGSQEAKTGMNNTKTNQGEEEGKKSNFIKDVSGSTEIKKGLNTFKEKKKAQKELSAMEQKGGGLKARQDRLKEAKAELSTASKNPNRTKKGSEEAKAWGAASKKAREAQKELDEYNNKQEEVKKKSSEAWSSISKGIGKAGQAIAAVGMGMSMIGGIMSSLGLEEAGEFISDLGQGITLFGGALMAIPPIIQAIQTVLKTPPLGIILIILTTIIALITIIATIIKNTSPEKKLQDAAEAAERASAAADAAAESYENLVSALEELDGKYKALEDLTRGTKEWNEAMRDINSSVLDLIDQYPELAGFVKYIDGILTIDTDSAEVQNIIQQAEARKITSKNASVMANAVVTGKENDVLFSDLKSKAKFQYIDPNLYEDSPSKAEEARKTNANNNVKSSKDAAERTKQLAKAISSGEAGTTFSSMVEFLTKKMGVAEEAAQALAQDFWDNKDSLQEYGDALNTETLQLQAAYDGIAASAQSLANTFDMTAEEIKRSANLVDGDISGRFYEEKMAELNSAVYDSDESFYESSEVSKAIKKEYGPSATIDKNGKVKYHDGKKNSEIDLSEEELKALIATQYATEKSAQAIGASDEAIIAMADFMGKGGNTVGESAVRAIYDEGEGRALTQAELKALSDTPIDYEGMWDALGEAGSRIAYGDDEEGKKKMIADYEEAISGATSAFVEADEVAKTILDAEGAQLNVIQDFMSAGQAETFSKKMKEVFDKTGAMGAQSVLNSFNEALKGKTEEEKQRITEIVNAYDWSTIENLKKMELDLASAAGVSKEAAQSLSASIIEYNMAIDSMATTVNAFGETYQAFANLESISEKITDLQWKYNAALSAGATHLEVITEELLKSYQEQYKAAKAGFAGASNELSQIYGQGQNLLGDNLNLMDYVNIKSDSQGNLSVDTSELAANPALWQNEKVQTWIQDIKDKIKEMSDFEQTGRDAIEAIEEMEQTNKDSIIELKNKIKDTLINNLQKQLNIEQEILDATRDANAQLISKIQEQLDFDRQKAQNEEAEKNISDMYSQMAYLGMDTSGAGILEQQNLEEDIAKAEEDYQQTLIDQSIQSLQDANAKAEEQRERQIALQEAAIDMYANSEEIQNDINSKIQDLLDAEDPMATAFGEAMLDDATLGMTDEEREAEKLAFAALIAQSQEVDVGSVLEMIGEDDFKADANAVSALGREAAVTRQKGTLARAGLISSDLDVNSDDGKAKLDNAQKIYDQDNANIDNIADWTDTITKYNEQTDDDLELMSKEQYYAANKDSATAQSYTNYVKGVYNQAIRDKYGTMTEVYGGAPVPVTWKYLNSTDGDFDIWVDGTDDNHRDNRVHAKAINDFSLSGKLSEIRNLSGENGVLYGESDPQLYIYHDSTWCKVTKTESNAGAYLAWSKSYVAANDKPKYAKFKTGGLADFTGPAWLDGTPSHPEYILNADQTERFFSLVDVLEGINTKEDGKKSSGDNYFDISINVDKLENDYDVEQVADKIRRMIYEDASYRNVNALNLIR